MDVTADESDFSGASAATEVEYMRTITCGTCVVGVTIAMSVACGLSRSDVCSCEEVSSSSYASVQGLREKELRLYDITNM